MYIGQRLIEKSRKIEHEPLEVQVYLILGSFYSLICLIGGMKGWCGLWKPNLFMQDNFFLKLKSSSK